VLVERAERTRDGIGGQAASVGSGREGKTEANRPGIEGPGGEDSLSRRSAVGEWVLK